MLRKRGRRVSGDSEGMGRFVEAASSTEDLLIEEVRVSHKTRSAAVPLDGGGGGEEVDSRRAQWTLTSSCR